jgi:putative phosphoesterase
MAQQVRSETVPHEYVAHRPTGSDERMEVVVLADSHLSGGLSAIGDQVLEAVTNADIVLHAGDITSRLALAELEAVAETYAVRGNNDHDLIGVLPESRQLELGGVRVALIHDSGAAKGRGRRLCRWFPDAHLVVFGHSHVPMNELGEPRQILFNPGSPTQRRSQPHRTFGRIHIVGGQIEQRRIEIVR